jgi:hypothetical protein
VVKQNLIPNLHVFHHEVARLIVAHTVPVRCLVFSASE